MMGNYYEELLLSSSFQGIFGSLFMFRFCGSCGFVRLFQSPFQHLMVMNVGTTINTISIGITKYQAKHRLFLHRVPQYEYISLNAIDTNDLPLSNEFPLKTVTHCLQQAMYILPDPQDAQMTKIPI